MLVYHDYYDIDTFRARVAKAIYVNTEDPAYHVVKVHDDLYVAYVYGTNVNVNGKDMGYELYIESHYQTLSEAIDCVVKQYVCDAYDFDKYLNGK